MGKFKKYSNPKISDDSGQWIDMSFCGCIATHSHTFGTRWK